MGKLSLISIAAPATPRAVVDEFIAPSPNKKKQLRSRGWPRILHSSGFWFYLLLLFAACSMIKSAFLWRPRSFGRLGGSGCERGRAVLLEGFSSSKLEDSAALMVAPLRPHETSGLNLSASERKLWAQPNDLGFRPCLEFSGEYVEASKAIAQQQQQQRKRFLMVIVNGGLNQQRNQIVDAVIIARILEAALVVPVLQMNQIWGDESEFADIFDVEHFKRMLKDDIKIVSSLPSTHVLARPPVETGTPLRATPEWIRSRYARKMNKNGLLMLRGIDSKLSNNLPPDLQKLRCKVAFHALRFAPRLQRLGERLARRMWRAGPYVALHLRLEKDVWVRTGCLPGLGQELDEEVRLERVRSPQLLTSRLGFSPEERRAAGLCPLGAAEVARVLRALGGNERTRVFWAGGEPMGGAELALAPLRKEFPILLDKFAIAKPGELEPLRDRASSLAAIDYIIALSSDVFMPSHGGNMAHAMRGHRAYMGHRKFVTPQKRELMPIFGNSSLTAEEAEAAIRRLHRTADGRPAARTERPVNRDVLGFPVPECMCRGVFDSKLKRIVHRIVE